MGRLFLFCLFVAAVPWTQAQARGGGHGVVSLNSAHSGVPSVASGVHTNTSAIAHVPQINMNLGNANSFKSTYARLMNDPLNNNPILNPPGQQVKPLPAPKPTGAPTNPLGPTVETKMQTAVNGYTVPQVRQVQSALHRLGYYHGPVDGDFGLNTQTALESYQIHSGSPVTGTLTLGVLSSLGVAGSK